MQQFAISTGITIASALLIAMLQTLLRYKSRRKVEDVQRIKLEDLLFWSEWIVAASFTITAFIIQRLAQSENVGLGQFLVCVGTLFVGYVLMPSVVKRIAYDPKGSMRNWMAVLLVNFLALAFIVAVVGVGVRVIV